MVVTKVNAIDLGPDGRDGERVANNLFLDDREDQARAERRNALGSRFTFMRRIAGNDLGAFLGRVVFGVVNRHGDDGAVFAVFHHVSSHHVRHAHQRRECHRDQALGCVRAGDALEIHIRRRLFIEPHIINRVGLPLAPALLISL